MRCSRCWGVSTLREEYPATRMASEPIPKPTFQRRQALLKWLRAGLPIDTAARLSDLTPEIVSVWRRRSTNRVLGYITLEADIQKAMAEGQAVHLARITEAGKANWRASAWLLERMYPEQYAPPAQVVPNAPPSNLINDFPGL
jgi:hypothetical protein